MLERTAVSSTGPVPRATLLDRLLVDIRESKKKHTIARHTTSSRPPITAPTTTPTELEPLPTASGLTLGTDEATGEFVLGRVVEASAADAGLGVVSLVEGYAAGRLVGRLVRSVEGEAVGSTVGVAKRLAVGAVVVRLGGALAVGLMEG
jgi:hypothetical protein